MLKAASTYRTSCKVIVQLIKGHSGSLSNDIADEIENIGSKIATISPEPIVAIPFNLTKTMVKEITKTKHKIYWEMLNTCGKTKIAFPKLNSILTRKLQVLELFVAFFIKK